MVIGVLTVEDLSWLASHIDSKGDGERLSCILRSAGCVVDTGCASGFAICLILDLLEDFDISMILNNSG